MLFFWPSERFRPDPVEMLWHYVTGDFPNYLNGEGSEVGWGKYSHRGIQRLDCIRIPRRQRRYVFSKRFEVRYNQAFEQVVWHCGHRGPGELTWLSDDLAQGYTRLHKLGFAHSFEAWENGQLAGGAFGVQLGSIMTVESMFYRVSNATKAAYGQALFHLRDRGFRLVDTNGVSAHMVNYGEEWVPQWQFEQTLRQCLREWPTLLEGQRPARLPWRIRAALPIARILRAARRRLSRQTAQAPGVQAPPGMVAPPSQA